MKSGLRGRTLLVVFVLVLGAAFGGGFAFATIPDSGGVLHGCYSQKGTNQYGGTQLNIIDSDSASCKKDDVQVTWNQSGPPGAAGNDGVSVTSVPLGPGDANCPDGGSQFTAADDNVTYACNGAKGPQGDPGPSAAYTNYGDGFHRIQDGTTQTVASVSLPAGSYVLSGSVRGFDIDDFEFLQCNFVAPGATVNGNYAIVQRNHTGEPMLADVTLPTNNSVFLRCNAQEGGIDAAGQMIATRVGSVTASL